MSNRLVAIAGWVTVVAGFALMLVHYYAGTPDDPEGWFASVGFAAPFIGAGALCLIGDHADRPLLCVAAGIGLAVMSLVSIVMIPLLLPAAAMFTSAPDASAAPPAPAVPFVLAAGLVLAFGYLVFHQDPATWSTPYGGGSSSNIVTRTEATISLAVTTAAVIGSSLWSRRTPNHPTAERQHRSLPTTR
jgi:hypothetical protein